MVRAPFVLRTFPPRAGETLPRWPRFSNGLRISVSSVSDNLGVCNAGSTPSANVVARSSRRILMRACEGSGF